MKNVVDLSEYRVSRTAASIQRDALPAESSRHPIEDTKPVYYCKRCDGDAFKIYASGEIHCVNCGKRMRNIFVAESNRVGEIS